MTKREEGEKGKKGKDWQTVKHESKEAVLIQRSGHQK
jgi:hypothetical protein